MEETQFWGDTHSGVWTRVVSFGSPMTLSWRGRRGGHSEVAASHPRNIVRVTIKGFPRGRRVIECASVKSNHMGGEVVELCLQVVITGDTGEHMDVSTEAVFMQAAYPDGLSKEGIVRVC